MSLVLADDGLNINILYKNEYLTIGMVVWVGMERVITFSDFKPVFDWKHENSTFTTE